MRKLFGLALILAVGIAPAAFAQVSTGNIYGDVKDESAAVLPGASVALEGEVGTRSTTSSGQGDFRFLRVDAGIYTLRVSMAGFTTVERQVRVTTGENVNVNFTLRVATVEETVTVTAETPLVDVKKRGTSTAMTEEELYQVPNARDPWGVLKAVPGVLVDRMNIAGNENGQQANFAGKGSTRSDANFNMDGLVITDMSATGASPSYYDMGAFQEISVSTGANDLQVLGGGVGISMVTKRGTNKFHGGARYLLSDADFSFGNLPSELDNDSRLVDEDGTRRDKADHISSIKDYGFELGGPIWKDHLWFQFSYGKQDIKLIRLVGTPDDTLLPSWNAKINWQAGANTMVSLFGFDNAKQKFGREAGFGVQKSDSFNWNQDAYGEDSVGGPDRPTGLYKIQVDHTFSPNFFVTANAAYMNTGFGLAPRGGLEEGFTVDYVQGVATGSYLDYLAIRPQNHLNLSGNYFFEAMGGNHELKFGFGYRKMKTTSQTRYGGGGLSGYIYAADDYEAVVQRDAFYPYNGLYTSAYIGDTFTKDRMTLNLGVRWDGQKAKNEAAMVPANPTFPNVLPPLDYPGSSGDVINWSSISPRIGFSYALDEDRKTVVRGSYAMYAEQLSFGWVTTENPVGTAVLAYGWNDGNGDRVVQPGEVDFSDFHWNFNVDPDNPAAVADTVSKVDRDLTPRKDHEVVLGVDRELGGNFAVGMAYTFRTASDWMYLARRAAACGSGDPTAATCPTMTPDQYTANDPSTANGYTAFTYSPIDDIVDAGQGGRLRTNAPGYSTTYNGVEMTLTKRLSNKWMSRLGFSVQDWNESWDGTPYSIQADGGNPTATENDPVIDGGNVSLLSGGSGKASFYTNTHWQFYGNALYQLPWDVDVSTAVFAKQGGAYPVSLRLSGGRDGTNSALATNGVDELRYDMLFNMDIRLAKTVRLPSDASLVLSAEWFNVLNSGTVLSRYRYANSSAFTATDQGAIDGRGRIEEILSPSIFRFGARLQF